MNQPDSLAALKLQSSLHYSDGTDGPEKLELALSKGDKTLSLLPIVPPAEEHRSFILSTWLRSYEAQARKNGWGPYYKEYEPRIAESRWQDGWVVTDEDGFTVHAWVCGHDGILWHVYVVPQLRRCRIATRLIELATGGLKEYAKSWPYAAHARVNPYRQTVK